jgi:transcriptional regulator with XRE-family HTH domain
MSIDPSLARRALGLTQKQMAAAMGVTPQHWRKWEAVPPAKSAREMPPDKANLLRAYLEGYRPADWPGKET